MAADLANLKRLSRKQMAARVAAVNSSSDTAHTGWLIFLAIMTYLVIAVAGVTHEALLLETPVQLPILQVKIQLKQFFQFAPIVLVLFHLGILAQLVLLARKTLEFDHAIRLLETSDQRTHPLRLELHNFFFVQAIAGPQRSVSSGFLNIMSWLTIVILPVVLLLYMQVAFLPYHDVTTTWINRIILIVRHRLRAADRRVPDARPRRRSSRPCGAPPHHPLSSISTTAVLARRLPVALCGDGAGRSARPHRPPSSARAGRRRAPGVRLPFRFGAVRRHAVRHLPPQPRRHRFRPGRTRTEGGEHSLNLRGRDLRYAKLDRTDLRGADLTGANLDGASLVGANLRALAQLRRSRPPPAQRQPPRPRAAPPLATSISRAAGGRASVGHRPARRQARRGAARRRRPEQRLLTGASFSSAHLEKADLTGGVQAQGTNFLNASLQGADLTGAELQLADFTSASLQGRSCHSRISRAPCCAAPISRPRACSRRGSKAPT